MHYDDGGDDDDDDDYDSNYAGWLLVMDMIYLFCWVNWLIDLLIDSLIGWLDGMIYWLFDRLFDWSMGDDTGLVLMVMMMMVMMWIIGRMRYVPKVAAREEKLSNQSIHLNPMLMVRAWKK